MLRQQRLLQDTAPLICNTSIAAVTQALGLEAGLSCPLVSVPFLYIPDEFAGFHFLISKLRLLMQLPARGKPSLFGTARPLSHRSPRQKVVEFHGRVIFVGR